MVSLFCLSSYPINSLILNKLNLKSLVASWHFVSENESESKNRIGSGWKTDCWRLNRFELNNGRSSQLNCPRWNNNFKFIVALGNFRLSFRFVLLVLFIAKRSNTVYMPQKQQTLLFILPAIEHTCRLRKSLSRQLAWQETDSRLCWKFRCRPKKAGTELLK